MADGFIGLFQGISAVFGSFFDMQFLGTNLGYLIIAFSVVGMVFSYMIVRFMK